MCSPSSAYLQLPVLMFWITERGRWLQNIIQRKKPPVPHLCFSLLPLTTKKELFILTPTDILAISFLPLFSVLRGRGHTQLLSSISKAHRPGPDGSVSLGSSDWELKIASDEGYLPPLLHSLLVLIVFLIFHKARQMHLHFVH